MLLGAREGRKWTVTSIRLFWPIMLIALLVPLQMAGLLAIEGIDRIFSIRTAAPMLFWFVNLSLISGVVSNLPVLWRTLPETTAPTYYYFGAGVCVLGYLFSVADPGFNPKLRSPTLSFLCLAILSYGFLLDLIQLAMCRLIGPNVTRPPRA